MDFTRIAHVIAVEELRRKVLTVVGVGGAAGLCRNFARCGVRYYNLIDPDIVAPENICRQEHMADQVGMPKVEALAAELSRINQHVRVRTFQTDFRTFWSQEPGKHFWDTDLFVYATDNHDAQASGNALCLMMRKPGVWIGLYPEGAAGEVFFWKPGLLSCHCCMLQARYDAQKAQRQDPPSAGADVVAVTYLDSLASMIILGMLTEGTDTRYGRLIADLGERQFLQVKIDPAWNWNGRDLFREQLQIPEGNDTYFGFVTIARRNPDPGGQCEYCKAYPRRLGALLAVLGEPNPAWPELSRWERSRRIIPPEPSKV